MRPSTAVNAKSTSSERYSSAHPRIVLPNSPFAKYFYERWPRLYLASQYALYFMPRQPFEALDILNGFNAPIRARDTTRIQRLNMVVAKMKRLRQWNKPNRLLLDPIQEKPESADGKIARPNLVKINNYDIPNEYPSRKSISHPDIRDYSEKFNRSYPSVWNGHPWAPHTCDWLLEEAKFRDWEKCKTGRILFIVAGPGRGKTILAEFIKDHLERLEGSGNSIIVNFSFYQPSWIHKPEILLYHAIHHIKEKFPEEFARIYATVKSREGGKAEYLWALELLKKLRQSTGFQLHYIVDAVDEYWNNAQGNQKKDIEKFLTQFCGLCDDEDSPDAGIVKILFTSRDFLFLPNLQRRSSSSLVLNLTDSDLHKPVERFINTHAGEIFSHMRFSDDQIQNLLTLLIKRSDTSTESVFLYAYLVIEETRKVGSKKNAFQAVQEVIQHYRSSSFNKLYEQELLRLVKNRPKNNISSTIAESLKILYFAETALTLNQLKHFLALRGLRGRSDGSLWDSVSDSSTLKSNLQQWCGVLITIQGDDVRLSHHTVREYLGSLQKKRLALFSCHDLQAGIQMMATLCIHFLTVLRDLIPVISEETGALDHQQEERLLALWETSFFTVMNWDAYVGALRNIKKLWPLLSKFLEPHSSAYELMLSLRWIFQKVDNSEDSLVQHQCFQPAGTFLAENGMVNVLKMVRFVKNSPGIPAKSSSRGPLSNKVLRFLQQNDYKQRLKIQIDQADEFGNTMLHYAAANGSVELLRILLKKQADGSVYNKEGATPFRQAVASGSNECVRALIDANQAAKEEPSTKAISTLQFLAGLDWVDTMNWALKHGWQVEDDMGLNYWPPLYVAALFGSFEMVSCLLCHGADPGRPTRIYQDTPVHAAVESGKLDILELLLGDKPSLRANSQNDDGDTPIYRAALKGNRELFELLHSHQQGAKRTPSGLLPVHAAAIGGSLGILEYLSRSKEDLFAQDHRGCTILHHAAANGHLQIVEFCIRVLEMDVNLGAISAKSENYGSSDNGNHSVTPLVCATESGKREVVEFLLNEGASLPPRFPKGHTLLHSAANSGDVDIFEKCLQRFNLDPMATNSSGVTPLHTASSCGHTDIIRYIYSICGERKGFDIDQPDDRGSTCLHYAILSSNLDAVNLLIELGADPMKVSKSGTSCLTLATAQKNNALFDRILELDSRVNHLENDLSTPIHYAGFSGNAHAIRRLCEHGADPNQEDNVLFTPLEYILSFGHTEAFDTLISAKASIFHRDCTGVGILDRVNSSSPLWLKLKEVLPLQRLVPPLEAEQKIRHIIYYIQELLRFRQEQVLVNKNPSIGLVDIAGLLLNLDSQSLEVESDVRILIEALLTRMMDGRTSSEMPCRCCESDSWYGSAYICRTCWHLRLLCEKCYCRRLRGMSIKGCLPEHDYIVVGDEFWRSLPPDKVNKEGESFEEWFRAFERRYNESPVERQDLPSTSGIEEVMEVVRDFLTQAY